MWKSSTQTSASQSSAVAKNQKCSPIAQIDAHHFHISQKNLQKPPKFSTQRGENFIPFEWLGQKGDDVEGAADHRRRGRQVCHQQRGLGQRREARREAAVSGGGKAWQAEAGHEPGGKRNGHF